MLLLNFHYILLPVARKTHSSTPKKLSDYRMKPHQQAAIANVANIVLNSIFAVAANNQNDCMQAMNQVLTSIGNITQIVIERPRPQRHVHTTSDEKPLKTVLEDFFSQPEFLELLQRKLEEERYLFILKLRSLLKETIS